ncbi:MAG: hypothetical protein AAF419_03050, partial [Pseudomonadota bacterium]
QSIRDAHQKAIIAPKGKSKFEDVVCACALADEDEFGTFSVKDLIEPYFQLTGDRVKGNNLTYNLQRLCESERDFILTKTGGSTNVRYQFTNPLMKVYIKMKLDQKGKYQQPSLFTPS